MYQPEHQSRNLAFGNAALIRLAVIGGAARISRSGTDGSAKREPV